MKRILPVWFIMIVLFGCGTITINSKHPNNLDLPNRGVIYSTPVNQLQVDIEYVTRKELTKVYGAEREQEGETEEMILKKAAITEKIFPDPRNEFVINVDEIADAAFYDTTLDFQLQKTQLPNR